MHDSQNYCLAAWEGGIRGQTRILSLEPVSHELSRNKRDHVRSGDTHSKGKTSLFSSSPSTDSEDKLDVKQHISFPFPSLICRVNRSHVKEHRELFTAPKMLPI